jgi:hypothetical protein
VNPVALAGGQVFSYSVFSESDGVDNDTDGSTDEADESGSISIVAQGRLNNYDTSVQYSGIFTETMADPNPPTWNPNKAFVAGGDLTVKGSCEISGANGSVHSNQFLDLGGSSKVTGDATSSNGGNIDPANVAGEVDTGAPAAEVPHINQSNMQDLMNRAIDDGKDVYKLNSDGSVSKDGLVVSAGGEYHGWSISGDTWTLSSSKADLDGLFYTSGDVKLTGGKDSISMTVLSEGNVTMSGNGDFTPYFENFFLISLHDIKISGTPQQTGDLGVIVAREQIMTTGNAFIRGVVVAADLDNASEFVDTTTVSDMLEESMITGNFGIEYNGGFTTDFPVYDPNANRFVLDPTFSAYEER